MQSLQQAQRVLSSRGCSTSGTPPHVHACITSSSSYTACSALLVLSKAGESSHSVRRQRPGRRRTARVTPGRHIRYPAALSEVEADVDLPLVGDTLVSTTFVAETTLPTRTGKYRVRAYRHSVSNKFAVHMPQTQPLV